MAGMPEIETVAVTAANVDATGFFCLRSKRGAPGHRAKRAWLEARFAEGLRIRLGTGGARGFIEYIPGAYGWRAVEAPDHMLIHCLWVTGRSRGTGLAVALLDHAAADARAAGLSGIAVVASSRGWLAGSAFYLRHGFAPVAEAPPSFTLLERRFSAGPTPRFPRDWRARAAACGPGLTVFRTDQCPYLADATDLARGMAADRGVPFAQIVLDSAAAVRRRAPSPYGVYGLVLDGRLVDDRPRNERELAALLDAR